MTSIHALLVSPEFPVSYWGYQHALEFIGKKAVMPPLGLLTVAGMFPSHYDLRVVDMNVTALTDADMAWADIVFTSTMIVQKDSLDAVAEQCRDAGVPLVAGGPHPTSFHGEITGVDHFVLGEVERVFPVFLSDWESGVARRIYETSERADIADAPLPRYDLIDMTAYDSMALQFSRGCPLACEFCDITKLFGRVPRTKSNEQMLAEMDLLYELGWRGSLFFVDDNFIGNRRDAMRLMTAVAEWQKAHDYPFSLYTEATVSLAGMDSLMDTMVDAGLVMVFLGIETPNPDALRKTRKHQNIRKGQESFLLDAVRTIQSKGIEVAAGFILGLDEESEEIFDQQIEFVQESGIPRAMVGLLQALKGTELHTRLEAEGRLLHESAGSNVDLALNFVPEMGAEALLAGYKRVLTTVYDSTLRNYFERCFTMYRRLGDRPRRARRRISKADLRALLQSLRRQMFSRQGPAYVRFLARIVRHRPRMFAPAVTSAIIGYHFEKVTRQIVTAYDFRTYLDGELAQLQAFFSQLRERQVGRIAEVRTYIQEHVESVTDQLSTAADLKAYVDRELTELGEFVSRVRRTQADHVGEAAAYTQQLLARAQSRYASLNRASRHELASAWMAFHAAVNGYVDQVGRPQET
ncbi:radical SAM protein [Candidatus Poribacteria bacterium]|nr:radical SAM protein [Candidatus Poribacteria bacterium]